MLRLDVANLDALDAWIASQREPRPSRPEAIRRLLAGALGKTAEVSSIAGGDGNAGDDG